MNTVETIQTIRQQMQQQRNQLTSIQQHYATKQVTERLINSPIFLKSQHIACYVSVRNELGTHPLIEKIWQAKKFCYLPILNPAYSGYMRFARYKKADKLIPNVFSIPEPARYAQTIPAWALDLVIVPLLAFDQTGNRLGSGCGYYDRVFAHKKQWPRSPALCGFAYHQQQVKQLPAQPWDVPMDYFATDQTITNAKPTISS